MAQQTIVDLLQKLRDELSSGELDNDTLALLEQFDTDIQSALERKQDTTALAAEDEEPESLVDTAKRLETLFAAEHPVAESLFREIVNTLAKMGI